MRLLLEEQAEREFRGNVSQLINHALEAYFEGEGLIDNDPKAELHGYLDELIDHHGVEAAERIIRRGRKGAAWAS
ncbi:MAG: hypothetical protein AAFX93_20025 [Verrucomicrobiota bacterium]